MPRTVRMLIVSRPQGEVHMAAEIARAEGAEVLVTDTIDQALTELRIAGADLALVDVSLDVASFIRKAKAERMELPVLGCGVDAPADRAVAAIRAGAKDYLPLPPQRDLIVAAITALVERPPLQIVGEDEALKRAISLSLSAAETAAPILIAGERGTGKAVLARAVHGASRRAGRFVTVECTGAQDVAASELFGHEAGAFPGAVERRTGGLEKAADGTLLLRDIDALSPENQAKLADALHQRLYRRTGGQERVTVTSRIIATTSRNLEALVEAGSFRGDLRSDLGLVHAKLPPLRERGDDIEVLANAFASQFAETDGLPSRPLSADALTLLRGYDWPGNIRELEDMVHRAVLLATGGEVSPSCLVLADGTPLEGRGQRQHVGGEPISKLVGRTVDEVERDLILETLERCDGNRTSASNILGISVRTMRNKLRTFAAAGIPVQPAG